jgi:lipid II:glycine glycyltransferase (peptidoglycan interpeptide bridge formation enzyme)
MDGAPTVARLRADDDAWDSFVKGSSLGFHTQLTPWIQVKAANGWGGIRVVADAGSGPIGAQVLTRRLGPGPFSIGYAPRGPVATTWDQASLGAFQDSLRRTARRLRLTHVTIDPPAEDDATGRMLTDGGWRPTDEVQPRRSWELPLAQPEEALWGGLRSKWRQYVQKARRSGVVVTDGGREDLRTFYDIFVETALRTGFIPRTFESYVAVWDAYAPSGAAQLLFARLPGGEPVATLFVLHTGSRAVEPYGGMTPAGAESRANYLLKWEAIRRANEAGAAVYDMWGLKHSGIEQFKRGFGGREATYVGAFDLVTLPLLRDALVTGRRVWLPVARRLYTARHGSPVRGGAEDARPAIAADA